MNPSVTRVINKDNIPILEGLPKETSSIRYAETYCQNNNLSILYAHRCNDEFFASENGLLDAIWLAYYHHLDLVLSPDMIWLSILQSFSIHLEQNAEKLRSKFVSFEGKKELSVVYLDFVMNKDIFEDCFMKLNNLIEKEISKETLELLNPGFSTSSELMQTVSRLSVMNTMKSYFTYVIRIGCGIRAVRMEGTTEDWMKLISKADELLANFEMDWWAPYLMPVLYELLNTFQGSNNPKFWDCCIRAVPSSGSKLFMGKDRFNGWILNLSPFKKFKEENFRRLSFENEGNITVSRNTEMKRLFELYQIHDKLGKQLNLDEKDQDELIKTRKLAGLGMEKKEFSYGLSSTNFIIVNYVTKLKSTTKIVSGFVGTHFNPKNQEIRPVVSWFFGKTSEEKIPQKTGRNN